MSMLGAADLGELLESFDRRLFRMETLPRYAVTSDGDDYHRYTAGEREPNWTRKQPWLNVLRASKAAGKQRQRVRLLSAEPTDYELYSCEWGYALNVDAGEDVRVLRRGEHEVPVGPLDLDFWVIDDHTAVAMVYDLEHAFRGAQVLTDQARDTLLVARDAAWDAAEPFGSWWGRHPELHRQVHA